MIKVTAVYEGDRKIRFNFPDEISMVDAVIEMKSVAPIKKTSEHHARPAKLKKLIFL